jgi:hypothetical protein
LPITNGYATLAQFKQRFAIASTDAQRDMDLELIIQAASRRVDLSCRRAFWAGTAGTVRYFTADSSERCYIDDFAAITAVETDDDGDGTIETTWAATDYVKLPISSQFGWPYTWLEITPLGNHRFPWGLRGGVKITGTPNWAAVPDLIREACLLQSNRMWQRAKAPFGVQGANEFGTPVIITKLDPDIEGTLTEYMRLV